VLDVCPVDVVRRFINWSWRFIDSYKKGLTGDAAMWVVCKQKGHQSVSESAIKALEAQSSSKQIKFQCTDSI